MPAAIAPGMEPGCCHAPGLPGTREKARIEVFNACPFGFAQASLRARSIGYPQTPGGTASRTREYTCPRGPSVRKTRVIHGQERTKLVQIWWRGVARATPPPLLRCPSSRPDRANLSEIR